MRRGCRRRILKDMAAGGTAVLLAFSFSLMPSAAETKETETAETKQKPPVFSVLKDPIPVQQYEGSQYQVDVYGSFTQLKSPDGTESVLEDSRLFMKRGDIIPVSVEMDYINGRIDQVVVDSITGGNDSAQFLSVLEPNHRIEDYYDQIRWPEELSNAGIQEISSTLDTSDTTLMVRYTDNTVAAFNYVTGTLLFKDESEKKSLSFSDYVGNWFTEKWNSLLGPDTVEYDKIKVLEEEIKGKPIDAQLKGTLAGNGENLSSNDNIFYNVNISGQTGTGQAGISQMVPDTSALENYMKDTAQGAAGTTNAGNGSEPIVYAPESGYGIGGVDQAGEILPVKGNGERADGKTADEEMAGGVTADGEKETGENAGGKDQPGLTGAIGTDTREGQEERRDGVAEGGREEATAEAAGEEGMETDAAMPGENTDYAEHEESGLGADKTAQDGAEDVEGFSDETDMNDGPGRDGTRDTETKEHTDLGMEEEIKVKGEAAEQSSQTAEPKSAERESEDGSDEEVYGALPEGKGGDGNNGSQTGQSGGGSSLEGQSQTDHTTLLKANPGEFLKVYDPETKKYELYDTQEYLSQADTGEKPSTISQKLESIGGAGVLREKGFYGNQPGVLGYVLTVMGVLFAALLFLRIAINKRISNM